MNKEQNNYNKEEWGGWKIVSDMLNKPDECGIYPTSECYQKLYDFVCEQKEKAISNQRKEIVEEIDKEIENWEGTNLSIGSIQVINALENLKNKLNER